MQVRIKICGITNVADAKLAASLGADMIGLNFYAKSPRSIDETMALSILDAIPDTVDAIGVFVVSDPRGSEYLTPGLPRIRTIQLHGNHPDILPVGPRWIPAFSVADTYDLDRSRLSLEKWRATGSAPAAILMDAHVPGQYGGTGQTAPWHLLADFDAGVPLILAGGLTPENVAEAIRIVRPYAVDVASGVESGPGKKDAEKMRRFIAAVRSIS